MKKFYFYFLSLTWGLPLTLAGLFAALFLRLRGYRSKPWGYCRYFEVGKGWGGIELGIFYIVNESPSEHILDHEHGHGLQNCLWGPLFPFAIGIPSFLRYHYRNLLRKRDPKRRLPPYDAIWFEGQASRWGKIFREGLKKTEKTEK